MLVAALIVAAVTFATCAHAGDGAIPPESVTESPALVTARPLPTPAPSPPPTEAAPTPYGGLVNPLTGLPVAEDIAKNRPYAIMYNNRKIAQPLLGISKADVIYEAPVEGGITRMLAIFQDVSDVGVIGSVRSARPYYIDLAQGYDAIYIHAGGSPQAYQLLQARNVTRLDGVNGSRQDIFFRDAARRSAMGYEHSLVTSGALISQYLPTYGFRLEHEDGYGYAPKFEPDAVAPGTEPGERVQIMFSSIKSTTLEYGADDGLYSLGQFDKKVEDGDGARVLVANVLILRTAVGQISGDTEGRLTVTLTGSGAGYFYCGGKRAEIRWSKKDAASPFVYTLEDGTALTFRTGRTYVAIISKTAEAL
ncbi:MAG: DUF3048 domain-containing protein [Oscillospiraceae bacterium]|nr:DUF3048 domain-containing protein [Oscillospiraceae bacterium]